MSLGLSTYHSGSSGEFTPRLEYNAKAGRYTRVDRTADGSDIIKVDVTMDRPSFAWDMGSIQVGWINFQSNMVPTFCLVPYGQPMPARPDRNHKAGFRSRIWNGAEPWARDFSSTAGVTVNAIEALWDQLTAMPEAAAGKVPVIQAVNVVPISGARGTNYQPVFSLLQWIDRDDRLFGPRTVAAPGAAPIVSAAAATPVQAPPAAWSAAPATPAAIPAAWPSTTTQKAA